MICIFLRDTLGCKDFSEEENFLTLFYYFRNSLLAALMFLFPSQVPQDRCLPVFPPLQSAGSSGFSWDYKYFLTTGVWVVSAQELKAISIP